MKRSEIGDVLNSSALVYICRPQIRSWSYLSFVQKKKRANTTTQFWYTDMSMIVLKRKQKSSIWSRCHCLLQGVQRSCDVELFLDPDYEYCIIPFSYLSGKDDLQCGSVGKVRNSALFRITSYSAQPVELIARPRRAMQIEDSLIESLHLSLIGTVEKITYSLGPSSVLVAVYKSGCIYFLVLNSSTDGLMMHLNFEPNQGMTIVHGMNKDTHIIPAKSQRIILVLANDGHHGTTTMNFSFQSDICREKTSIQKKSTYKGVQTRAALCLAGELLCNSTGSDNKYRSGVGTLDERLWRATTI